MVGLLGENESDRSFPDTVILVLFRHKNHISGVQFGTIPTWLDVESDW